MKTNMIFKGMAALLLMIFFVAGCNKEDDPPEEVQGMSFDSEEVLAKLPEGLKNSTDPNAESCVQFIESALDMSGFIDNMEVPDDAEWSSAKSTGSGTWQWSWRIGQESYTIYWTYEETSTKRIWAMDIQYNNGPRYNYIDAWESIDGNQGELVWNFNWAYAQSGEPISEDDYLYWKYTWSLDNSGAYHITYMVDADATEYNTLYTYEVLVNADGSGSVDYFMMDQLTYEMEWDVLGNGAWSYYINGEVYLTGLWTAEGSHD